MLPNFGKRNLIFDFGCRHLDVDLDISVKSSVTYLLDYFKANLKEMVL